MQSCTSPESALLLIDEFLANLRHPCDDSFFTPDDWEKLRSAMRVFSESLGISSIDPAECQKYRVRLHELRQEIFRLEQSFLRKRESLARERQQLQAASAWSRSTHLL
jgi:hypothetical protein